jgi:hypothetical protein
MPKHRQVFFIGGFDPKSPRYYHRLYRDAARRRPTTSAAEGVAVGRREAVSPLMDAWDVTWTDGNRRQQTRYTVLRWDDLIRQHWPRGRLQVWRDHWRVYVGATRQGVFGRILRVSKAVFWLAMLPLVIGSTLGVVSGVVAAGLWAGGVVPGPWSVALAVALWWTLVRLWGHWVDSDWLLRLYGFTVAQAAGQLPELDRRLDAWADELVKCARAQGEGEVLVVGHSTGSILAVSVVSRVLARWRDEAPRAGLQLGLVTLGHCTPILGWQNNAAAFRGEVARVVDTPGVNWLDVTAPADWAAFGRAPPWLGPARPGLRQVSPQFHRSMSAAGYQHLLRHRHLLHLHYLMPQERAGGYDVVALTAAFPTLADRVAAPSSPFAL